MDNRTLRRIRRNARSTERLIKQFNLELEHEDVGYCKYHWMPRDRSVIFVAYLTPDPHCDDPIKDCDGEGCIITKRDDKSFLSHVGRDTDGEPILDSFVEIYARLKGEDLDGFVCNTNFLKDMWEEAANQGKIGTPYAVPLRELYHGGYQAVPWDDDRKLDAVWIPDKELLLQIETVPVERRRAYAHDRFECAIEEFNKWATGDCYGVCVDEFRRTNQNEYERTAHDSCWGYIGADWAESAALDELLGTRKFFLANRVKKEHDHGCKKTDPVGTDDRQHMGTAREETQPECPA